MMTIRIYFTFNARGTTLTRAINVAEAKRRFSELLARTAFAGERFLIARRGRPLAALVALEDFNQIEAQGRASELNEPHGLLAAAKALADSPDLEKVMAGIYRSRRRSKGRRVALG